MELELKKTMLKSGIPSLFLREGVSLTNYLDPKRSDSSTLAKSVYDWTGPEYTLQEVLENNNFIYMCGTGDVRDVWFLFARALILKQEDVNVISYVELTRILKTRTAERTVEEAELLEMCDHCKFLFVDDFDDSTFEPKRRTDYELMMWYFRRKLEKGGVVVTYGEEMLMRCKSWPQSFLEYLKYRAYIIS